MNNCINEYFKCEQTDDLEIKMAGDMSPSDFLPLADLSSPRAKADLRQDIIRLTKDPLGDGSQFTSLDVIKVFLGLKTERIQFTYFRDNPLYGKYSEYDYEQLIDECSKLYIEMLTTSDDDHKSKRTKDEE